jgi:hypothetical protein
MIGLLMIDDLARNNLLTSHTFASCFCFLLLLLAFAYLACFDVRGARCAVCGLIVPRVSCRHLCVLLLDATRHLSCGLTPDGRAN